MNRFQKLSQKECRKRALNQGCNYANMVFIQAANKRRKRLLTEAKICYKSRPLTVMTLGQNGRKLKLQMEDGKAVNQGQKSLQIKAANSNDTRPKWQLIEATN